MSSCSDRNISRHGKEKVKGNSKSRDFMETIEIYIYRLMKIVTMNAVNLRRMA